MNEEEIGKRLNELESTLQEQIKSVKGDVEKIKKTPKDWWDKFQIIATLLIPASIGLVGYYVTSYQISLEAQSEQSIAAEDRLITSRQVKIAQANVVHMLIDEMSGEDETRKAIAFKALGIFAPEHAKELINTAIAVSGKELSDEARKSAKAVTDNLVTLDILVEKIHIIADCDQFTDFEGDFFYSFYVNDHLIKELPRSQAHPANSNEDIIVNGRSRVSVLSTPDAKIIVRGSLTDKDRGTSGEDDHLGTVEKRLFLKDKSWAENPQMELVFFKDEDCQAVAYFQIKEI